MNIAQLFIAKVATKESTKTVIDDYHNHTYYVFDRHGEYVDHVDLRNVHSGWLEILRNRYKNHIFIYGYGHKDEWRHHVIFIKNDGTVVTYTDFDANSSEYYRAIDPKNRKPWYWDRKLNRLKKELPNWDTDVQEAVNMRIECREVLAELERNFNINNSYYRIQNNAAMEAHSMILTCDVLVDQFEAEMHHMEYILNEREATNWTDEREDLHM